jgi:hypothetical protein
MYIIWFIFSIISLIVTFYAYRELKGYQYDMMGIGGPNIPYMGALNMGRGGAAPRNQN